MIIVRSGDTYACGPDGPIPIGWTLVRSGFATLADAQRWLWDAIDSIPEGYGQP
jgi:hypothetical protein